MTTPTRDEAEAILRQAHAAHIKTIRMQTIAGETDAERRASAGEARDYAAEVMHGELGSLTSEHIDALLATAPAPASGGVDAAFTVASNLLRDGCTYADRKAAADFIRSALSPAATPVSEAEPVGWIGDLTLQRLGNGQEGKIYPTNPCPTASWSMPVYLAKPASSPAVGDVREAAVELLSHLELYDFNERDPSGELYEFMAALKSALSQSTSAGRVGE